MKISPPIAVLSIVALSLTGTAWLMPPVQQTEEVTIKISGSLHQTLVRQVDEYVSDDGVSPTLGEFVTELSDFWQANLGYSVGRPELPQVQHPIPKTSP